MNIHRARMSRLLFGAGILGVVGSTAISAPQQSASDKSIGGESGIAQPVTSDSSLPPRGLYAPYWYFDSWTQAEVEIANLSDWPKEFALDLQPYGAGSVDVGPIRLSPFETCRIAISDWISHPVDRRSRAFPNDLAWGTAERLGGVWGRATIRAPALKGLVAKIRLRSSKESIAVDIPFDNPRRAWSANLSGFLWDHRQATAYLAVSNISAFPLEWELSADDQGQRLATRSVLQEGEMRLINLKAFLPKLWKDAGRKWAEAVGLRIQHNGPAGALRVWGFQRDSLSAAKPIAFSDPKRRAGNVLQYPAVIFGALSEGSLWDSPLHPYLLVHNYSDAVAQVTAEPSVIVGSQMMRWTVGSVHVGGHSAVAIDLAGQSTTAPASGMGSLVVQHSSEPSKVSAWIVHLDTDARVIFQDEMIDPLAQVTNSVSDAEFMLSEDSNTMLIAKNIANAATYFTLEIRYQDHDGELETHLLPWRRIEPNESIAIDSGELRREPDTDGTLLPKGLRSGSVRIVASQLNTLIAAFINADPEYGSINVSSHYSREVAALGSAYLEADPIMDPIGPVTPRTLFCSGTTSCAYYDTLCDILPAVLPGKLYYCGPGKYACENIGVVFDVFGLTKVQNCIRKCLQDEDDCVFEPDPVQFSACINLLHAECYAECFFDPFCYLSGGSCVREPCDAQGFIWSPAECQCVPSGSSPIILSEHGNRLELTNAAVGVNFDLNADGTPERISWTRWGTEAEFLALDRDGNGVIDDGRELFGDHSPQPSSDEPNGFQALAVFDSPANGGNGDGVISASDAVYSQLVLWNDRNHDAISQPEEIRSLLDAAVEVIHLRYQESRRIDSFGNQFRFFSRVAISPTPARPATMLAVDVFFVGMPQQ